MTLCPNIKKCNQCDEDHITFGKKCPEYKFQKDILNTTCSNKTVLEMLNSLFDQMTNLTQQQLKLLFLVLQEKLNTLINLSS